MKTNPFSRAGFFNRRMLISLALCVAGGSLGILAVAQPGPDPDQTGRRQAALHEAFVIPHSAQGPIYSQPPILTPAQKRARQEELEEVNRLPRLPGEDKNDPPTNPPLEPATNAVSVKVGVNAPNDFV